MKWTNRGFTLLDMLTCVAALVIVLGLMVSLARYVRNRSADEATKRTLMQLETMLATYESTYRALPPVPPLLAEAHAATWDQRLLAANARANSTACATAMNAARTLVNAPAVSGVPGYDGRCVRDGWGMPVVLLTGSMLLPRQGRPGAESLGEIRRFFLSAGPDRRYATQEDNLYSKDLVDSAKNVVDSKEK